MIQTVLLQLTRILRISSINNYALISRRWPRNGNIYIVFKYLVFQVICTNYSY